MTFSAKGRSTRPQSANYGSAGPSRIPDDGLPDEPQTGLQRGLSARQVQMIAIAGTIGTGLFLGTGRSLAQGGPASMLICYSIIGCIVYVTLLLLGEMATQYPVAGSFNAYTTRFFSPAYGFALAWNYWFNDAVSVASDLTAAQLVLQFWHVKHAWVVSVFFWIFLVGVNALHVRGYGELGKSNLFSSYIRPTIETRFVAEYWLSSLKIVTVILFVIVGALVNLGLNPEQEFIGFANWRIAGAPFVGGFGGFAQVFVTASFACMWHRCCYMFFHLNFSFFSRRHGEFRYHSRRNKESFEEYATGCETCLLENYDFLYPDYPDHWLER